MQTVTMLFSDIEGSTWLLDRLGPRYTEVLSTQRVLLRRAFQRWNGREMGTEGDSFFVVFGSVGDAVRASAEGQRALGATQWPEGVRVGVRMGLHTGEPTPHEDGYVGMDVHRAARVAGCAHGGQVVLSEATHRIAVSQRLDGLRFVDLGPHRLKDLPGEEHLYQLAAEDLPRDFPPLKSLGAGSSLPVAPTSLVGRDGELGELSVLLHDRAVRLLTLTGPGGSGKTRLAVELASQVDGEYDDGVYFVPLESVTTTEAIWTTIAEVLGVTGEERAPPTFLAHLAPRRALLVLDNLEHLEGAATVVSQLLAAAPAVQVLATSRRPLHCEGEHEHAVPPLTLPGAGADEEAIGASGAVQLFVQRARMVRGSFALDAANAADVAEICRALDGLPLAVELAAARVKVIGTKAVRARLDDSLELAAAHAAPDRQRTLRGAIEWSHALLAPQLQRVFRHLGVFRGSFDLQATLAVLGDGGDPLTYVAELLDVSLVEVFDGPDGEPRVRLLQTISAYAREQLAAAGELDAASRRHAEHYLEVARAESPRLRGADYLAARERIETELDNLRTALAWSLAAQDTAGEPTPEALRVGLGLCEQLAWFWYACGYQAEGRRWTGLAVDAAAGRESPELMATLHMLGVLMLQHGDLVPGRDVLLTCLAFWRRDGNLTMVARELNSLGIAHRSLGQPDRAREMLGESVEIARQGGDSGRLASALSNLSTLESDAGRHDLAIEMLHEARALDAERGDAWGLGVDDINLAALMLRAGRLDDAYDQLRRHAASAVGLGDPDLTADVLGLFCRFFAERRDAERTAVLFGASEALRRQAEQPLPEPDATELATAVDRVRLQPTPEQWHAAVERGGASSVDDALSVALADGPATSPDGGVPPRPESCEGGRHAPPA